MHERYSDSYRTAQYAELLAAAPKCRCGCGQQVLLHGGSLQAFLAWKDKRYAEYYHGHQSHARLPNWGISLTENERGAVLGTVLGDTWLGYAYAGAASPRLCGNHSDKQADWVKHKCEYLARLNAQYRFAENPGFGKRWCSWRTSCLPCLRKLYDLVHCNGKKVVRREVLDMLGPVGAAWWACDDGARGSGAAGRCSFTLHTEGFTEAECGVIKEWVEDKFGLATLDHTRSYVVVRLKKQAWQAFSAYISPHVPASMRYKLLEGC